MIPVALYARKSLETANSQTADVMTQILELRTWAEKNDYTIIGEYVDDGVRGWQESRPSLDKMLEEVRKGTKCQFRAILIVEWDRLYRDMSTGMRMLEEIESYGVSVISTRGGGRPVVTRDEKIGRLFGLMVAEIGNDISTAHKHGGQLRWAREGYSVGGCPPYGYKRDIFLGNRGERRVKYIIDVLKSPIVQEIYQKYADNASFADIENSFADRAILTPGGYKRWNDRILHRILFAPGRQLIYLGAYVYNRKRHFRKFRRYTLKPENEWIICRDAHEPILTQEIVDAVNAVHSIRGYNIRGGKR